MTRQVEAVRRFNRFYARRLQALEQRIPGTTVSPPESRLLCEIAHRAPVTGAALARVLALDAGYVSRLVGVLLQRGLVLRRTSAGDRRRRELSLSAEGRRAFEAMSAAAREQLAALLEPLDAEARGRLVSAMRTVEQALDGDDDAPAPPIVLRRPAPGDMGWVVQRHGELYQQEYGWDARFEAFVARIAADFIDRFDPSSERGWIAQRDGQRVGCAFLVRGDGGAAKLRMLLVDPGARGTGLGRRLVRECIRFATRAGYPKLTLWTNDVLVAARRIYADEGFRLVRTQAHHSFGHDLEGEYWERPLP